MNYMDISNTQYSLIFALGSLSAVFAGPAGFFVRRAGITVACMLFGVLMLVGATGQLLSITWKIYPLAVASRIAFWLGICTTGVVQVDLSWGFCGDPVGEDRRGSEFARRSGGGVLPR